MSMPPKDRTGQRFGMLVAVQLAGTVPARWLCVCDCGESTVVQASNLQNGGTKSCGCHRRRILRQDKPDDRIGYAAAHYRCRLARGPAGRHVCVQCGARAQHWALKQDATVVMTGLERPGGRIASYSPRPIDYQPMCAGCHSRMDFRGDQPRGAGNGAWSSRKRDA